MSHRVNTELIFWKEAHPREENMAFLFRCRFSGFKAIILSESSSFFVCKVHLPGVGVGEWIVADL